MATNWQREMANLTGVGAEYGIVWPDELTDNLKSAIIKAQDDGNQQGMLDLTRAFQSLVKIRNHFLTGE